MSETKLQKARGYEQGRAEGVPQSQRPLFHVTPPVGWLNDPNGFSLFRGEYHLFFQYHPYSTQWGPMHWGHCKSTDLIHWQRLPAALAPEEAYDRDGCFSGSAAEMPDGRQVLMYTGVRKQIGDCGMVEDIQTQCIAIGDGIEYEKAEFNPVIPASQVPSGWSARDFRDPKLWREGEQWYVAVANRTEDGSGAILLYTSQDLKQWSFQCVLDRSENEYGRMWECPDFFALDGTHLLLLSPQEMEGKTPVYRDGYETLCLLGAWDGERFVRRSVQPLDQGLDFYAPQTLLSPDGRRIMIGWLQDWDTSNVFQKGAWFGMLSLPRELHVRSGRVYQAPIRELLQCRTDPLRFDCVEVGERMTLPGVRGRVMELNLSLRPTEEGMFGPFTLTFAGDGRYGASLTYHPQSGRLSLERRSPCGSETAVHSRQVPISGGGDELKLQIILDRFSAEIFVNGGRQVLSASLYIPLEADEITFASQGGLLMDVERYLLSI